MKLKTSELTGAALDWAVSAANGDSDIHPYSTDWGDGGPIIEREYIELTTDLAWNAAMGRREITGPTPLVAAMRCYVMSQLGNEVDIPDELTDTNV
jgi:hypothetical protein